MKKSIPLCLLQIFILFTSLAGLCQNLSVKEEIAATPTIANSSTIDSSQNYQRFKNRAEIQLSENQAQIARLRFKKTNEDKQIKLKYEKMVLNLDQRNNVLKRRIKDLYSVKYSSLNAFKNQFDSDMDNLISAIAELDIKKIK